MAKKNQICKIVGFVGATDSVLRRFFELGLLRGTTVKVVGSSLLRKVSLLEVRGYLLSVRTSLLEKIEVSA
ncbi:MAG: ferrous iron transport protein A [Clostridia bacterium]|nr:ferrous iron transport protein A [Clostridia bacterium]